MNEEQNLQQPTNPALNIASVSKSAFVKTYVLTVSRYFPTTHKRKGERTFFQERIHEALWPVTEPPILGKKIHTVRANYPLWEERIKNIQDGNAILSVRYWSGKPYNSKQIEFLQLDKDSGVGIQKLEDPTNFVFALIDGKIINWDEIAKNDGLSFDDFCEWFKVRKPNPMAIIHFTHYRY